MVFQTFDHYQQNPSWGLTDDVPNSHYEVEDWSCVGGSPATRETMPGYRYGMTGATKPMLVIKPCACPGGVLQPPAEYTYGIRDSDGMWHVTERAKFTGFGHVPHAVAVPNTVGINLSGTVKRPVIKSVLDPSGKEEVVRITYYGKGTHATSAAVAPESSRSTAESRRLEAAKFLSSTSSQIQIAGLSPNGQTTFLGGPDPLSSQYAPRATGKRHGAGSTNRGSNYEKRIPGVKWMKLPEAQIRNDRDTSRISAAQAELESFKFQDLRGSVEIGLSYLSNAFGFLGSHKRGSDDVGISVSGLLSSISAHVSPASFNFRSMLPTSFPGLPMNRDTDEHNEDVGNDQPAPASSTEVRSEEIEAATVTNENVEEMGNGHPFPKEEAPEAADNANGSPDGGEGADSPEESSTTGEDVDSAVQEQASSSDSHQEPANDEAAWERGEFYFSNAAGQEPYSADFGCVRGPDERGSSPGARKGGPFWSTVVAETDCPCDTEEAMIANRGACI